MRLRDELSLEHQRWSASNFYRKFERAVVYVLTALIAIVIALATWRLALAILALVISDMVDPTNYAVFQAVFGAVFTVFIALEFKNSLLVTLHSRESVVQVRSVVLIALIALVRKFIIIDINTTSPAMIGAIAVATLSLGVVYWLVRDQNRGEESRPALSDAPDQDQRPRLD
jgi:uncharacterized membrane protein (DUF373 family)